MAGGDKRWVDPPVERIASMLQLLVHHRGLCAEQMLLDAFGEGRLAQIYDGDEPRFSELEEIATILAVPMSTFQITGPGDFAELEIAWAELLFHARNLTQPEREALATAMVDLIRDESGERNILELVRKRRAKEG